MDGSEIVHGADVDRGRHRVLLTPNVQIDLDDLVSIDEGRYCRIRTIIVNMYAQEVLLGERVDL
jgi:hypothetical protein